MTRAEATAFLQWCLPQLRLRWPGYRKVRGQVRKRLIRRLAELGLPDLDAYRRYLVAHPGEWPQLDQLCWITISRFFRDPYVWDLLADSVLQDLAAKALAAASPIDRCRFLRAWSVGCASGEEPYSLAICWQHELAPRYCQLTLEVLATDADPQLLKRAHQARYAAGSLKDLPEGYRAAAFDQVVNPDRADSADSTGRVLDDASVEHGQARERREPQEPQKRYVLREHYRAPVTFLCQDVRRAVPTEHGPFDLILCRNLVFTYFTERLQRDLLARTLRPLLRPGGALVLGKHERLPRGAPGFTPWHEHERIYRCLEHRPGGVNPNTG